eukprot:g43988.t1
MSLKDPDQYMKSRCDLCRVIRDAKSPDTPVPSVTTADIRSAFLGVNPRKARGLDNVLGRAIGSCADQLAQVFTDIVNLSLLQAEDLTCFKKATIIPVPKKAHAMCLNDYRPVALTSIMKCFKRSTADAISLALHSSMDHLDSKDTYGRLLLIDYTSTYRTIIPSRLISKLRDLGLGSVFCNWILSFPNHKTKELIIDFRKKGGQHINGTEVERVESVKFLRALTIFYRPTIESILSKCINHGMAAALPRTVRNYRRQKLQKPEYVHNQVQEQLLPGFIRLMNGPQIMLILPTLISPSMHPVQSN